MTTPLSRSSDALPLCILPLVYMRMVSFWWRIEEGNLAVKLIRIVLMSNFDYLAQLPGVY